MNNLSQYFFHIFTIIASLSSVGCTVTPPYHPASWSNSSSSDRYSVTPYRPAPCTSNSNCSSIQSDTLVEFERERGASSSKEDQPIDKQNKDKPSSTAKNIKNLMSSLAIVLCFILLVVI